MGKIRRVRQKFHQSVGHTEGHASTDLSQEDSFQKQLIGKSPLLKTPEEFETIPDNLFQGIDINFDSLKKKLIEDDRVSVRSIAKSCKYDSNGKLLTKKEKKKLKHDLFMRKLDTSQQLKKEALKKHKKRKGLRKSDIQVETFIKHIPLGMEIGLPENISEKKVEDFIPHKHEKKGKLKSIKKSKVRQQEMLQEVAAFQKILSNPTFVKDPCAAVTESVQKRIINELKKK